MSRSSSDKIINIKTDEAYTFKNLFDLCHNVFDHINIRIDERGVYLCDVNNNKTTMIVATLHSKNFRVFDISEKQEFSIESANLPKMTKTIKRKDNLALFIDPNHDDSLGLKVKDGSGERNNVNYIPVHDYETTDERPPDSDVYQEHLPTATINSSDFQKMCKSVNGIDKTVTIKAQSQAILFEVSSPTIGRHVERFGKWKRDQETIYNITLPTKVLIDISKCSSLSHNKKLRIYAKPELPFRISTEVGGLGQIDIYINNTEPST